MWVAIHVWLCRWVNGWRDRGLKRCEAREERVGVVPEA